MRINWLVRIKNKAFWLAIIPAVLLLVQAVAGAFGFVLELGDIGDKLLEIVNAAFVVLSLLGIVADPTTVGMGDSLRAQQYIDPHDSDRLLNEEEKIGGSE